MKKKIYLLDGHSLAHRAFYALPLLTNSDNEYTNAVFGFSRMLFKLLDDEDPDLIAVAFDKKAPTFRHQEYEEYKSTRKKMPEELQPQIDLVKQVVKALNIPVFEIEGYEADDIIGTLAKKAEKKGMKANIVSGDRDTLQLVSDDINVLYTKKGITDMVKYDLDQVKEEYELEPQQLIDMKGLMGDSSDNIPGVPGIGKVTAKKLLKEFKTMENVLDNIDQISGKKRKENLREYSEQAKMSKKLGKIVVDVPIEIDLDQCYYEKPDIDKIVNLFERLEFGSLVDRFKEREDVFSKDIYIKEVNNPDRIKELKEKINKNKEFAFDIILDDYDNPVNSEMKEILITVDSDTIYSITAEKFKPGKFKQIFTDEKIEKNILHAKEASIYLKRQNIELKGLRFDPLLAAYLINPSGKLPTLEDLLKNELDITLDDKVSRQESTGFMLTNIFKLKKNIFSELEQKNLLKLYTEIEIPVIRVLAAMEYNGIKVDLDYLNKLSTRWQKKLETITEKAYELAGEEFNLNSPKQLGEILFEKLNLPVVKKTKTGYSTNIDVLEKLEDEHEIIPLIIEYRQWAKFKSTYVDALPPLVNPETGRVHTSFNQMVTATGRLSSTNPNLQNIPIRTKEGREIRKTFIPKNEEWILLAADYSQIELRVLAHISEDESLKKAFTTGLDIHTETASKVFEVDPEEVTGNMRREAKVINFGIAYGMSPYGLSSDLDIPKKEAEEYINRYFERFTGVKKYMDEIKKQAKEKGYVETIFNRRRYIPEIKSRNFHRRSFAERAAINSPIQGSAADIMKVAMVNVYQTLKQHPDYQANLLLQVHDELVLEVKKPDLEPVAEIVKTEMEKAVELNVPLTVDLQTGQNWRDKEDYNI